VLVETVDGEERVTWHSHAIFRISAGLPGAWRALSWLGVLPRFLTDFGYRVSRACGTTSGGAATAVASPPPGNGPLPAMSTRRTG